MPTTADYLNELVNQKKALADNLNAKDVIADKNESFGALVAKVLEIKTT